MGLMGADGSREGVARDFSFAARFGRVVLRRGMVPMPRALFTYQAELGLSPQQLWFIGYILSFQWSTELPYPEPSQDGPKHRLQRTANTQD